MKFMDEIDACAINLGSPLDTHHARPEGLLRNSAETPQAADV
jgi:hypothetical protein